MSERKLRFGEPLPKLGPDEHFAWDESSEPPTLVVRKTVGAAGVSPDNHPDTPQPASVDALAKYLREEKLPLLGSNQDSPDPEAGDKGDHVG